MAMIGQYVQCIRIYYQRSLAAVQLFQQCSFCFFVSSQSRSYAYCLIVIRICWYGKTPFYVFDPNYLIFLEINPFFVLFNLFICFTVIFTFLVFSSCY